MAGGKGKKDVDTAPVDPQTESIKSLRAMFPDWEESDLLSELQAANFDVHSVVDRITSGKAEQWGTVGKKPKAKKSEPEPEQKKKADPESHANGASVRGRGRGGASNTGTRGVPAGRGGKSDQRPTSTSRESTHSARGTGRPAQGRSDAASSRPADVVISSQDWDADTTAAAPVAAAPAPAPTIVNSWSNTNRPWQKPAVTQETVQPAVAEVTPTPVVVAQEPPQTAAPLAAAPAPAQAQPVQPAPVEPAPQQTQPSSYQFAKPQAAPTTTAPAAAAAPAAVSTQPQTQPQKPQSQPQAQPAVAAAPVAPQAHIQQTSLRMPPALVPTLEDVEKSLQDQAAFTAQSHFGQSAKGGFAQKDSSPVVLPSNAAIQGLNLRFGSLGLGVEEPAPVAAPSVTQQNGTNPTIQAIPSEKTAERPAANFAQQPQKAPEAHQKPQTQGAEVAYPGATPDQAMFNYNMQNVPQYGMPMGYGFYDGVDVNMQQRMMFYDPAFQHSPQHLTGYQAPPVKQNYGKADPAAQTPQGVPPQGFPPMQYPPQFFPYYPVPGQYAFQQNVGYGNPFPHNKGPYYNNKGGQGQYNAFPPTYNNAGGASNGQTQSFAGQGEDLDQTSQAAPQTSHQPKYNAYPQSGKGPNVGGAEGGYKGNNYDRQPRQSQPGSYYQGSQGQGQSHTQGQGFYNQGQGQGQNYPRYWSQN